MFTLPFDKMPYLQAIPLTYAAVNQNITLAVLRLDVIHPEVSGNKWFKLQFYLNEAIQQNSSRIATFGGAYSNHILATAVACKMAGMPCIGFIRGEEKITPTLKAAANADMELHFISRTDYRNKTLLQQQFRQSGYYWVQEGGYGEPGAAGAATIHRFIPSQTTHITGAVGTGTMLAGLLKGAVPHQTILGIPVLKGAENIQQDIALLVKEPEKMKQMVWLNTYHFGGYAKHNNQLLQQMNEWWQLYRLPTDKVYTAKLMWAVFDLIEKKYFPSGSNIVAVHSGGLQGNASLLPHILKFS
ncbi:pyridoxal-phosphate dependent enzyme [Hydrotalea sp.]|uniref:1-aminocyclopropane-1-carboxylate deaminase/D-cysteine desulfhydrase n=1 Tax=Hydrotalea sp. TaxID=2881279 RepID=UPI00258E1CD3|nr:pyridoxal-phosphate dependent enzyme [Hydrotalea sp.]